MYFYNNAIKVKSRSEKSYASYKFKHLGKHDGAIIIIIIIIIIM